MKLKAIRYALKDRGAWIFFLQNSELGDVDADQTYNDVLSVLTKNTCKVDAKVKLLISNWKGFAWNQVTPESTQITGTNFDTIIDFVLISMRIGKLICFW